MEVGRYGWILAEYDSSIMHVVDRRTRRESKGA
jgi:hypothetical protein